jgi:hypothetical protein
MQFTGAEESSQKVMRPSLGSTMCPYRVVLLYQLYYYRLFLAQSIGDSVDLNEVQILNVRGSDGHTDVLNRTPGVELA